MKPKWKNECCHPEDSFLGTIYVSEQRADNTWYEVTYDVYVYKDRVDGHGICLRYGDDGPEYLSPGSIENVVRASRGRWGYIMALDLINKMGVFVYERRNHEKD